MTGLNNIIIKYGTTRTVFLVYKYAIKIPSCVEWRLFLLGLLANMQESIFSKTKWPELCPVIFSLPLGLCVIMERAKEISRQQFFNLDYNKFIHQNGYVVPVEHKLDSFGILEGEIVAVDYGN